MGTEGKWEVETAPNTRYIVSVDGKMIIKIAKDVSIQDAEFICKAVNNHDRMKEALQILIIQGKGRDYHDYLEARDNAEQLLKEVNSDL